MSAANLLQAVATLQATLTQPGKGRCWGCNRNAQTSIRWRVAGFTPSNPTHPPIAYLLCPSCAASQAQFRLAAMAAETMSRDMAERAAA